MLEKEGVALDLATIATRRRAAIWCGATIERADVEALLPWLDWAYAEVRR